MQNLAAFITRESVLRALSKIIKQRPKLRKATKYRLIYDGESFPPKEVIRYAANEIGIVDFRNYRVHGGETVHKKLRQLGFTVEKFPDSNYEKRIARLCWNDNGWIMPSGKRGKSGNEETHEGKHGYGHEEWLMDIGKLIDGYHYGFLEPVRRQQNAYENKIYNIWLYSIDADTKKRYWIGEIKEVEVLDKDEAEEAKSEYIRLGWFQQMEEDILESGANSAGFSDWKGVDLFNIKYLPINLKINSDYVEIPEGHPIVSQSRYSFSRFKEGFDVESNKEDDKFSFESFPQNDLDDNTSDEIETRMHVREPKSLEIKYLHKLISKKLKRELQKIYGNGNVRENHPAGYGANKIDIVVKDGSDFIFYEIKSYTSLITSIREAIGQLMEYAFWTNKRKAKKLIVITQPLDDIENAKVYFKHLRESFNLPLYYQSFDFENNIFSEII